MYRIQVITPITSALGLSTEDDVVRLKAAAGPHTELSVRYISNGRPFIEGNYDDAMNTPATVDLAIEAERDGMQGIVINCTADTGLAACRECVSIPVVGPTESAMHLAAQLAHRFSVLTFSELTIGRFERMASSYGVSHKLASVRSAEISLEEMDCGDEALVENLVRIGCECIRRDGAHALVMGCTAYELVSEVVKAHLARQGLNALVLKPYTIAVKQAEALVQMELAQSKLSYPFPKSVRIDKTTRI